MNGCPSSLHLLYNILYTYKSLHVLRMQELLRDISSQTVCESVLLVETLFSVLELHNIEADRKQKLRFEKELISAKTH